VCVCCIGWELLDGRWVTCYSHFFFWFFGFFARSLGAHQFILFASLVCWCCVHVRTRVPGGEILRRRSTSQPRMKSAQRQGFFPSIIPSPATTKQARTCATSSSESDATPSSVYVYYKPSGNWLDCIGREEIYTTTTILWPLCIHVYSAEKSKPFNTLSLCFCIFLFCSASSGKMTGHSDSPTKSNSWINEGKYKIRVHSAVTRHSFSAFQRPPSTTAAGLLLWILSGSSSVYGRRLYFYSPPRPCVYENVMFQWHHHTTQKWWLRLLLLLRRLFILTLAVKKHKCEAGDSKWTDLLFIFIFWLFWVGSPAQQKSRVFYLSTGSSNTHQQSSWKNASIFEP
jgi:hypothetical protein